MAKLNVGNPLPISFKDFAKNPVVGTMFLVIVGISVLYIDIRSNFKEQIESNVRKVEKLEQRVDGCQDMLRRTDSSLSSANSKLQTLNDLGAIRKSVN
jgi:hypothetical protein